MPLTDFVRYLNAQLPEPASALRANVRFRSDSGRVYVDYADLRLASEFSPVIDTGSGELRGHSARLLVTRQRDNHRLDCATLFALPDNDQELIFVDRLVRTLHTLNYLTYGERGARRLLLLKVHPRHVASVAADHGLAFEEILRACGLLPSNVVLELEIIASDEATGGKDGAASDPAHWLRAAANYQARGYGVAVKRFGGSAADFALVELVRPALVRVDTRLSAQALAVAAQRLRALGCRVLGEGVSHESARAAAWESGLQLLQQNLPSHAARVDLAPVQQWSAAA